jgi:hypothetical protein
MSYINLLPNAFSDNNPLVLQRNNGINVKIPTDPILNNKSPGTFKLYNGHDISKMNSKYALSQTKETLLTFLFFSKENICNLQNVIKFSVYNELKYTISNQSYPELLNIMRNVFTEYSNHPRMIREDMTTNQKVILYKQYKNEVARLNRITIDFILPQIVSEISGYIFYLKDLERIAVKESNPIATSVKGEKEYRSITSTLIGNSVL